MVGHNVSLAIQKKTGEFSGEKELLNDVFVCYVNVKIHSEHSESRMDIT